VSAPIQVLGTVQAASVAMAQLPVAAQQAPCGGGGCGQGFGMQTVPAPLQVLGVIHATWVATVQAPEGAQQAPVGTQVLGVQLEPPPCQVLPAAHAA
jgi:hypothetical protein